MSRGSAHLLRVALRPPVPSSLAQDFCVADIGWKAHSHTECSSREAQSAAVVLELGKQMEFQKHAAIQTFTSSTSPSEKFSEKARLIIKVGTDRAVLGVPCNLCKWSSSLSNRGEPSRAEHGTLTAGGTWFQTRSPTSPRR